MTFRKCLLLSAFVVMPLLALNAQRAKMAADNSDWWSTLVSFTNLRLDAPSTNLQRRYPMPSNFQIDGVTLGTEPEKTASKQFGKATQVVRGDGAYVRTQTCYVSTSPRPVHLIFEEDGEGFGSSFYLFDEGPNWNGSDRCAKSSHISINLRTASGLRLGATPSEVQAILGKPSTASSDRLVYVFEVRRKTTATALEQVRRANPNLSDAELRDSFGFNYLHAYIEARFLNSRLTYLAVTKSENFP